MANTWKESQDKNNYGSKTSFLQQIGSATSIKTKTCFAGLFKRKTNKKPKKAEKDREILYWKNKLKEIESKSHQETVLMNKERIKKEERITKLSKDLEEARSKESTCLEELCKSKQQAIDLQERHETEMIAMRRQLEEKDKALHNSYQSLEEVVKRSSEESDELRQQAKAASEAHKDLKNYQQNVSKIVDKNIHVYGNHCKIQAGESSQMVCEEHSLQCLERLLEESVKRTTDIMRQQAKTSLQLKSMKKLMNDAHTKLTQLCKENTKLCATLEGIVEFLADPEEEVGDKDRYSDGLLALQQMRRLTIPVTVDCIPDTARSLHQMIAAKYAGVEKQLLQKLLKKHVPVQCIIRDGNDVETMTAEWLVTWTRKQSNSSMGDLLDVLKEIDEDLIKEEERRLKSHVEDVSTQPITNDDLLQAILQIKQMITESLTA